MVVTLSMVVAMSMVMVMTVPLAVPMIVVVACRGARGPALGPRAAGRVANAVSWNRGVTLAIEHVHCHPIRPVAGATKRGCHAVFGRQWM